MVVFTLTFFHQTFGQVHEQYPVNQPFYTGGQAGMMKDMIRIAREHRIPKCKNKNESYSPSVLVYPDGKINLVKDFDSVTVAKNKCAFEFTKAVLPHLKGWVPAVVEGNKVKAIAKFTVLPFFISTSKVNPEENIFTPPTFSDGMEALNKKISLVLTNDVLRNTDQPLTIILLINNQGMLSGSAVLYGGTDAGDIHKVSPRLKNISGDWAPATLNSVTFDWFLLIPMDARKKNFRSKNTYNFNWDSYQMLRNIGDQLLNR